MEDVLLGFRGSYTHSDSRRKPTKGVGVWILGNGDLGNLADNAKGILHQALKKQPKQGEVYVAYKIVPDFGDRSYRSVQLGIDERFIDSMALVV